jgi:putative ABC transport system permease protein
MDFIKLVLIANSVAFPIALWAVDRWLQEYAYHIEIGWWIFVIAAIAATAIAFITIAYQAFKSAVANPVDSLRSE